ncbi:MAG TPA: 4-(cytidine 5'-diphospho)-2-C-methyl-D-erythritol kinase [bacterium]|nr:4-(cytidine 5'-diphospho)-2-C-methyl-D-erythritol kinase [bacterium]
MKETLFSPAKINLRLDIVGRDPATGYHFLEMVLAPITLSDEITIEEAERLEVVTANCAEHIPSEKNIVHRIIRAVEAEIGRELPPLRVTIRKETPTGAGMGGGSGNGATMLDHLDHRFALGLGLERKCAIATRIGSDIPFFLHHSPALVKGFGEQVYPFHIVAFPFSVLLVHPGFPVETKGAYALWDKKMLTKEHPVTTTIDRVFSLGSLTEWLDFIRNDFEIPVFGEHPALTVLRDRITACGALKAFMTGSGSTMVGLFTDDERREAAFRRLSAEYGFVRKVSVLL